MTMRLIFAAASLALLVPVALLSGCPDWLDAKVGVAGSDAGGGTTTGSGSVSSSGSASSSAASTSASSSGDVLCPWGNNKCAVGEVCCYKQGMQGGGQCKSAPPCNAGQIVLSCSSFNDCSPTGEVCCATWNAVDDAGVRQLTGVSCKPQSQCTGKNAGLVCGNLCSNCCPMGTCQPFKELGGGFGVEGYGLCP
jgi:hypothetical protein